MTTQAPRKKVAIVQSNYIPWKGYFDLIASVDEFILYDDVQYTRRDWRNRNLIKTPQGLQWLSVPVVNRGRYNQLIREVEIDGESWAGQHWKALTLNYRKAPHFELAADLLQPAYLAESFRFLSSLNRSLIETICAFLDIRTIISSSSDYVLADGRSDRLASLCEQAGASQYVSGPAAAEYLEVDVFSRRGIDVSWFSYSGYPEYPQLWGPFVHQVSIVDMLFNCGTGARELFRASHP